MVNKLKGTLFIERPWGSEILWGLTDKYVAKTIEVKPDSKTKLIVHEERDKSIIVIKGPLYLVYGKLGAKDVVEAYKLPEGWAWHIESGNVYRYMAMTSSVMLIEVSSSDMDDGHVIVDDGDVGFLESDFLEPPTM